MAAAAASRLGKWTVMGTGEDSSGISSDVTVTVVEEEKVDFLEDFMVTE